MPSASEPGSVTCDVAGGVAQVRLARPDRLNALTFSMLAELVCTGRRLARDESVRAVVLSGQGRSFCSGLDLQAALADRRGIARALSRPPWRTTNTVQEACWVWRRLRVPVVAVVHGHCFGAGLQLALGADLRVTSPEAQWSVMEVKHGLVPDMTGTRTLSELVGLDVATRLTLTAEVVQGVDAHAMGLATVCDEDPTGAAHTLVEQIVAHPAPAVAAAKRLLVTGWGGRPGRVFARERAAQRRLLRRRVTRAAPVSALNETMMPIVGLSPINDERSGGPR